MKSDNSYAVAVFGIPDFELELVERIFSLSQSRDNIYRIVDESQTHTAVIALVDKSNADSASEYEQFHSQRQDFPTVMIANGKDPGCADALQPYRFPAQRNHGRSVPGTLRRVLRDARR